MPVKSYVISGLVALTLAMGLYFSHKEVNQLEQKLTTQTTETTTLRTQIGALQLRQETINVRLEDLETTKQEFKFGLDKAVRANEPDSRSRTPAAVVDELCKFARCR